MGKNGVDNDEFTYGSPENIETRGGEKDWVPERLGILGNPKENHLFPEGSNFDS